MPSVVLIDSIPLSITPEEYTEASQATPLSFSDIPPVLRHKAENVRITFEPPLADLSAEELQNGTLYVLESVLAFLSQTSGRGFKVEYPTISLHAIARSDEDPCVYCHLDEPGEDDGSEYVGLREMKIFPQKRSPEDDMQDDDAPLNQIFRHLSDCSSLHPDADDSDEMNFGLDMGQGVGAEEEAFVDGDVESIMAAQNVDSELELSEVGRNCKYWRLGLELIQLVMKQLYEPQANLARFEAMLNAPEVDANETLGNGSSDHSDSEVESEPGKFADAETPDS